MLSPEEIKSANILKDQAADDALLPEWIETAKRRLIEGFRGGTYYIGLPGIGPEFDQRWCIWKGELPSKVAFKQRFADSVHVYFEPLGWHSELFQDSWYSDNNARYAKRRIAFQSIAEMEQKAKDDAEKIRLSIEEKAKEKEQSLAYHEAMMAELRLKDAERQRIVEQAEQAKRASMSWLGRLIYDIFG